MAAYRRVYDSRYMQADCKKPGATEPYARQSSMGYLCRFMTPCRFLFFLRTAFTGYYTNDKPLPVNQGNHRPQAPPPGVTLSTRHFLGAIYRHGHYVQA